MADSLENRIEGNEIPEQDQDSLTAKVKAEEKRKGGLFKFIGNAALTGGIIAATFGIVGFNSVYVAVGNAIGYLIEIKKNKERFKVGRFLKEVWTGAIMGVVGTGIYTVIDKVPVEQIVSPLKNVIPKYYTLVRNVAKTLAFNPGILFPYLAFYKGFTYLRDKVGLKKTIFRKKGETPFKDMYQKGIKPDFGKGMGKLFKLFPIHYVSLNYVTHIPTRIIIGVVNDILFRFFQRKEVKATPNEYKNKNILRDRYGALQKKYQDLKDKYQAGYMKPALAGSY